MQLYYNPVSAPCRAVMLLFHAINMKPDMMLIDPGKGDQMTPEYLKLNPQHTVPLLVDNGFVLSESRAILGYVAEKYAMQMAYYPNDPMARGVVNQRLMFDLGTLYQRFFDTYMGPLLNGEKMINKMQQGKMFEALGFLEMFIGDAPYMAGDKVTIADMSLLATISSIEAMGVDFMPYPKIWAWYKKVMMEMPNYEEANGMGAKMMGTMVREALNLK